MKSIKASNVNHALRDVLWRFKVGAADEVETRNGPAMQHTEPMCVTYLNPRERVLFWDLRDANPFFHFMEGLWMLSGSDDVAFPATFAKQIKEYSDDGVSLWGAYGHRWKNHFDYDQVAGVIEVLRQDPTSRRAVIGMWDPAEDLPVALSGGLDIPCNTSIYFQMRGKYFLDMMVSNRSNDVIWGMCGANAVHMSMLQEYVAAALGVSMGQYHQVTMNAHVYLNDQGRKLLAFPEVDDRYNEDTGFVEIPYGDELRLWDRDLAKFMDMPADDTQYETEYFNTLVAPMFNAWYAWQQEGKVAALSAVQAMADCDWKIACREWLERRSDAR